MTLLEAMRLLRSLDPLDPEDSLLVEAIRLVHAELKRLAPAVCRGLASEDRDDIVGAVTLSLFHDAVERRIDGELEATTDVGARAFLKMTLFNSFRSFHRRLKPERRRRVDKPDSVDGVDERGERDPEPELLEELKAATDEFENDIPEAICSRKRKPDAAMFGHTLASLKKLRDKRTTTAILIEEEAGDVPPERHGTQWKRIRSRIQARMKRCRDEIAAEILSRRRSGRIDEQREHWLKLLLGQIQFHESPKKKVKRVVSDPDQGSRQGGRRKGKRSSAPSGGTK